MTKKKPSNLLLIAIGCFVISIWTFKGSHYKSALQTRHWPSTTGTIIQSQIHHVNPNHIRDSYQPNVSYTYQVNGINYQGATVYKGDKSIGYNRKTSAQKIINQFPVGKTVQVYYSPLQAQDSVLIPGPVKLHYMFLLLAGLTVLGGVYFLRAFSLARLPQKYKK
ncbi:MAG: DUF3592 domain-containing protein [Oligoflexia bacterium]|nr:DUF3592 domain-containing protein [Oligoflexia bacterium]